MLRDVGSPCHNIELSESEKNILKSISNETLSLMIDRINPKIHGVRNFMKTVATAVVTLATGTAVVSLDGCSSKGIRPDRDTDYDKKYYIPDYSSMEQKDNNEIISDSEEITEEEEPDIETDLAKE